MDETEIVGQLLRRPDGLRLDIKLPADLLAKLEASIQTAYEAGLLTGLGWGALAGIVLASFVFWWREK